MGFNISEEENNGMIHFTPKIVAFCDEGQYDWDKIFNPQFLKKEIHLLNVRVFGTGRAFNEPFDVFMFDWGGMSPGNDMMEHFIRRIYSLADNHPSKDFVFLSRMTKEAYVDFLSYGDIASLPNIYTFDEFTNKIRVEYERS